MSIMELAIDVGTSYTSIYKRGTGLVLREPSVVVLAKNGRDTLVAAGESARRMVGKTPEGYEIVYPIVEGLVSIPDTASRMLGAFLSRIQPNKVFKPLMRALVTAPCGARSTDKAALSELVYDAGVRDVLVLESPICTAIGLSVPLTSREPVMIVDIGGGKTEIAVVTPHGVIAGCTLGIGGNKVDRGIVDYVVGEYAVKLGMLTAERVKIEVGSLYPNDGSELQVSGVSDELGEPVTLGIGAHMIYDIVEHYYANIVDTVRTVMSALPIETAALVKNRGIYVCGGGAQMAGLGKMMSTRLQVPVITMEESAYCTVNGAGQLLANPHAVKSLLENRI